MRNPRYVDLRLDGHGVDDQVSGVDRFEIRKVDHRIAIGVAAPQVH